MVKKLHLVTLVKQRIIQDRFQTGKFTFFEIFDTWFSAYLKLNKTTHRQPGFLQTLLNNI